MVKLKDYMKTYNSPDYKNLDLDDLYLVINELGKRLTLYYLDPDKGDNPEKYKLLMEHLKSIEEIIDSNRD